MSALFGKPCQNGYVVRDIDSALKFWTEVLHVGPFFYVPDVKVDWFRYRGVDSRCKMSIALANSGDLQIELIQQRNDAPSMYLDFLRDHGEGMQHMSYWSTDYQSLSTARSPQATWSAMKARSVVRRGGSHISRARATAER